MSEKRLIGVLETSFGVSEALALFLFQAANEEHTYEVQRIDNPEDCGKYNVLIGVGTVFDAKLHRFPANSKSRRHSLQAMKILYGYTEPLSTAGLVYAIHGWRLLTELNPERSNSTELKYDFRRVFEFFIEIVDRFTFGQPIVYPTNEKEELMQYLSDFSAELKTALRNSFKKSARDLDFLTVVDVYSSKIGAKFHEMLNWYYHEYLRLTYELTKSMMYATSEHPSGCLAVCDFDFGKVTFKEVLARANKYITRTHNGRLAMLLVKRSKDCYRVECLSPSADDAPPTITFPVDWPIKGDQIKQVLGISDVCHISDCGRHAITATKEAAVALATALIEYADRLKILPDSLVDAAASSSEVSTRPSSSTETMERFSTAAPSASECPSSESAIKRKSDGLVDDSTQNDVPSVEDDDDLTDSLDQTFDGDADVDGGAKCTFVFDLSGADESAPPQVSVELPLADVSLAVLNEALRTKYPDFGAGYALCHRNSRRTAEASDFVRETPWFWRRQCNEFVYAPIPAAAKAKSITSDDEDLYETASSTFENDVASSENEEEQIVEKVLAVDFHTVFHSKFAAELLAVAIVTAADPRFFDIVSIKSAGITKGSVKIGHPNALCYTDATNSFNEKQEVSMTALDMLACKDRMSCVGIAFARFGLKSIAGILAPRFGPKVCHAKTLCRVFRRVYARLIHAIDELVSLDAKDSDANMEKVTPEAKLYVITFGCGVPEPDTKPATDEEARIQFRLNLSYARQFYQRLVIEVFHQLFPQNV